MKVSTTYQGGMRWAGGDGPTRVVMDANPDAGGKGEALNPKQMVLQGLAGCTGLDVAAMITKRGIRFEGFSIDVEAEQTAAHPKVFKQIKITYRMKAAAESRPAIERAIEQSETRFCGVSAMLGKSAAITWELVLEPL